MNTEFDLTVVRSEGPDAPRLRIETSRGVSLGATADGRVTVVLLGMTHQEATASRLAQSYLDHGQDPARLGLGSAGCAILDQAGGSVTTVMPPVGLRQVFWTAHGETFGLASRPRGLAALGGRTPELRPDAIFRYLYFHMLPGPDSIFAGVQKLDGGHRLRWDGQSPHTTRYWCPRFEDQTTLQETEASQELLRVLRASVARALEGSPSAGAFLSGGLDSSTVAGLAAELRPGLHTVTMGFDARGYDEMEYARIAVRRFATTPLEYYVTPDDVLATLPAIAGAFPEPFGNSSAAATYHCARIARDHGLDRLLAGDGGDELFGGNERYAKQLVFERYQRVPHPIRRRLVEPLIGAAARVTQAFPFGKASSYVEQANVPLPDRLQSYNFLHRHAPEDVFPAELLAQVDRQAPLELLRDEYRSPATTSAVNRMLFLDWKFTLHDNDLVKVNTMCDFAGVEVAYPMLDPAVIDFSLRIPGDWKVRRGELRWWYKRAMRGFLPDEIIAKTKHGFGLPFGVWNRTHDGLRRLSEDALGSLGERGYFRTEFLDEALRLHREGHASYYGELVWILTVLELWLQQHLPGARL